MRRVIPHSSDRSRGGLTQRARVSERVRERERERVKERGREKTRTDRGERERGLSLAGPSPTLRTDLVAAAAEGVLFSAAAARPAGELGVDNDGGGPLPPGLLPPHAGSLVFVGGGAGGAGCAGGGGAGCAGGEWAATGGENQLAVYAPGGVRFLTGEVSPPPRARSPAPARARLTAHAPPPCLCLPAPEPPYLTRSPSPTPGAACWRGRHPLPSPTPPHPGPGPPRSRSAGPSGGASAGAGRRLTKERPLTRAAAGGGGGGRRRAGAGWARRCAAGARRGPPCPTPPASATGPFPLPSIPRPPPAIERRVRARAASRSPTSHNAARLRPRWPPVEAVRCEYGAEVFLRTAGRECCGDGAMRAAVEGRNPVTRSRALPARRCRAGTMHAQAGRVCVRPAPCHDTWGPGRPGRPSGRNRTAPIPGSGRR